jgi:hypothetical protein
MRRSLTLCASTATLCLAVCAPLAPQTISSAAAAIPGPLPGRCGASADTVPPQITSLMLTRSTVDVANGSNTVGVTAGAIDTSGSDVSGARHIKVTMARGRAKAVTAQLALSSGTAADGTWRGTLQFPRFASDGTWRLTEVDATDAAGNGQTYAQPVTGTGAPASPTDIRRQSTWDRSVTVTGASPLRRNTDRLVGFTLSPRSVNTTHRARMVRVSADFAGTRPKALVLELDTDVGSSHAPTAASFLDGRLRRTGGDHWTGQVTIPRWVGHATATATLLVSYPSSVKPGSNVFPEQLRARGFPHAVRIVSAVDRTPPVLTHLTVTPSSVDVTSQAKRVTVTATAHDRQSGIAGIRVNLHGFGPNNTSDSIGTTLTRHGDTWTGHATVPQCVVDGFVGPRRHAPSWLVDAIVVNHGFVTAHYPSRRLAKHKFSSTLAVTSNPGDVLSPIVRNIAASGTDHTVTFQFSELAKNVTSSTVSVFAVNPASTRFDKALPITAITCTKAGAPVDCSGTAASVRFVTLVVPDVTSGQRYELYANQQSVTSQLTDAAGNPVNWAVADSLTAS